MNLLELFLQLGGTVAFAASGAMVGIRKKMDVFGVTILGITTAVGGGVIRDVILGNTPPVTFRNPLYVFLAILVSLFLFLPPVRRCLLRGQPLYERLLLIFDTLGLGIFTVTGMATAFGAVTDCPLFLAVFVGMLTGVGGGVLRDMMAGDTPYIFVKQIYACASLLGAISCGLLWERVSEAGAVLVGLIVIVIIRGLSAHYQWNLPRAD